MIPSHSDSPQPALPTDNIVTLQENSEVDQCPSAPTKTFICIKIDRANIENQDEDLMAIIRSVFKAFLRSSDKLQILAPDHQSLLPIRDNHQLPAKN